MEDWQVPEGVNTNRIYDYLLWKYASRFPAIVYGHVEKFNKYYKQLNIKPTREVIIENSLLSKKQFEIGIRDLLSDDYIKEYDGVFYVNAKKFFEDAGEYYEYCEKNNLEYDTRKSFDKYAKETNLEPCATINRIKEEKRIARKQRKLEKLQNKENDNGWTS